MKEKFDTFKELSSNPKGKAVMFFGFYVIFFIILMIVVRVGDRVPLADTNEYEKGVVNQRFYANNIMSNNYSYVYSFILDGVKYEYVGERNGEVEKFLFNNQEYYRDKEKYYVNNGKWIEIKNPYIFQEFLDINNYSMLLPLATFVSKTSYQDNKESYNYLISSNTINQKLNNVNSDFFEEPNSLILETDLERNVKKIIFKLDSYCQVNNLCSNELSIELSYDRFGEITNIANPTLK